MANSKQQQSLFRLNTQDYVRVTQTTGAPIIGRFDGTDYTFEDHVPSDPVHVRVAHHVFGFGGTHPAKVNALHRLGWLTRMDEPTAMAMLNQCVSYEPLELMPKGVLEFKREDAGSPVPPIAGSGSAPASAQARVGEGAAQATPSPEPLPDPRRKATRG